MINIQKFIKENSDFTYAEFNRKFIATNRQIFGVRIPTLRKFAKEIEPEYIELETACHEEILLYGFSAGNSKTEDEQLEYLQNLLPHIDNWCTCDCIVCSLKKLKSQKSYQFFCELLTHENPFEIRVGIVGLMRYFINSKQIDDILQKLAFITQDQYYVKMAISWFYAELCTKDFKKAKAQIEKTTDKFIRNKSISKARESYRVSAEQKEILAKMRI